MKIGIYYGSTTGNAQSAAEAIRDAFAGEEVACESIADAQPDYLAGYDLLILGSSTWGDGELQDDWISFLPKMDAIDLTGRKVALFGMGDQSGWADTYADAMGILYDKVIERGATVIGSWPTDGYEHSDSQAVRDGRFVGLALDDANQSGESTGRIAAWVADLRKGA